jgi:hypothetical protein
VGLSSSNSDTTLAKATERVTLEFTSSEPIETPTVTLAGETVETIGDGTNWTAYYFVQEGDDQEPFLDGLTAYYPFSGNAKDESENNHDGTVHGATLTEDRFGNANHAYHFAGNSHISFDLQSSSDNSFTWSFWLKDDSATTAYRRWLSTTSDIFLLNTVNVREERLGLALDCCGLRRLIHEALL